MRLFIAVCLLLSFTILHAQEPPSTKVLLIGTTSHYPPFASVADQKNNFVGFEIDIMQEICNRMQTHCNFQGMTVQTLAAALMTDQIDLAIGAIIIPSVKISPLLFSLPYLPSSAQFMAEKQSNISVPADIKNKRVGVRSGTLFNYTLLGSLVKQIYSDQVTVIPYPKMDDMLEALKNHEIDVVFTNAESVRYWQANNSADYKLIGSAIPIGNGYGVMGKKGEEQLIENINRALLGMEADGTYLNIYSRYFH